MRALKLSAAILGVGLFIFASCGSDPKEAAIRPGAGPAGTLYVLGQTNGMVYKINTATFEIIDSFSAQVTNPHYIDFAPNGLNYYLTTLSQNGVIAKFDATADTLISTVNVGGAAIPSAIAITSDNMFGYVCNFSSPSARTKIYKFNLNTMTLVDSMVAGAVTHDLKITADGQHVIASNRFTNDATVLFTAGDTIVNVNIDPIAAHLFENLYGPFGVKIDNSDSLAFVACVDANQIRMLDISALAVVDSIDIPAVPSAPGVISGPTLIAVSPDNSKIFVTTQWANSVVIAKVTNPKSILADIPLSVGRPFGITMSADGSRVYVACVNLSNQQGSVYVIDGITNALVDSMTIGVNTYGIVWRGP